ncbi:MAG TPA: SH3 domain-containing protein, partial [Anaerolineales bacterium]|nr:SH3 domain-containing protein [Anaerolineales bacterium]
SNVLGILPPDSRVQIVGKDPGENWWQIEYPPGRNGKAWVAIEFVRLAETGDIPVVENNELLPANGVFGIILEPVNIRSGPGTDFSSIGTLKPQDSVTVTGKDANGTWFQINFESGPDGKGWISAAFVQVQGVENLPIVAASGAIVGTGTPTEIPFTPTPTLIPAPIDNDSAQAPAKNITLSATGSRSFQYSSDLSSPNGDNEDWIQFIPFTGAIWLVLDCIGNGTVALEVFENNNIVQNMICGENAAIKTTPGRQYIIHIKSNASNGLQYTLYRLWVDSIGN